MTENEFKVGDVLVNDLGQFTKIISLKNGKYGLSGWSTRSSAEKETTARQFLNIYGLKAANLRVLSSASIVKAKAPAKTVGKTTPKKVAKAKAKAIK
jgi:hypothetical protein